MECKNCKSNISENAKFCSNCGKKIDSLNVLNNIEPLSGNNTKNETNDYSVYKNSLNLKKTDKNNITCLFILGGVLLGIIITVLSILTINKTSNTPALNLKKSLNSLYKTGKNSGEISANLLIESENEDPVNLIIDLKYEKKVDSYDVSLKFNKSKLNDEINLYSTIADNAIILYVKSSFIYVLGFDKPELDIWLYQLFNINNIEMKDIREINLYNILDMNHYKYVGKENGLDNYQLIIDKDLLNNIRKQIFEGELNDFKDTLFANEMTDIYYINIFFNESNEFVKASLDITDKINGGKITKAIISFEIKDLGNTNVEIPMEAKNSTMDLESFISTFNIK